MNLHNLTEVIKTNKGVYYTIRIKDKIDLLLVIVLIKNITNYISATNDIFFKYVEYVEGHDFQCVCVYENSTYDVHNHDCNTQCLFDFTKE